MNTPNTGETGLATESVAGEEDPGASVELLLDKDELRCHTCGGTGMLNGAACPDCDGRGKIAVGIGGA